MPSGHHRTLIILVWLVVEAWRKWAAIGGTLPGWDKHVGKVESVELGTCIGKP
jgi:hypothetical protein